MVIMTTAIELTKKDYLEAQRLHLQKPILIRSAGILFYTAVFLFIVNGVWQVINGNSGFIAPTLGMSLLLLFFFLNRLVIVPRRLNRKSEKFSELQMKTNLEISEDTFRFVSEYPEREWEWSDLVGWKENAEVLLFYISDTRFHIVPKRCLKDTHEYALIKEILKGKSIPVKRIPPGSIATALFHMFISIIALFALLT